MTSGEAGGLVHRFGDDVSTDHITSGRHRFLAKDMAALAAHCLEDLDPEFARRVRPGDFVVGGKNFGCGSSREYAPRVLQALGVEAVIARSFARIFFRNAINIGFPAVEAETDGIAAGDRLRLDLGAGTIESLTRGVAIPCRPYPPVMLAILRDGGLVAHLKKHGTYRLG
ncbi:MAG: 3-isopropylmalate dehydratase small subunit [Candidatus Rokuibacteriota bacterium]